MVTQLLYQLFQYQIDSSKKGYLPGIFNSIRFHKFLPYKREDENIFFSAAIAFNLQELIPLLSSKDQVIALDIIQNVIKNYPYFKNPNRNTYNFFKTNPLDFFPNGVLLSKHKFFKLADDCDDSTYVFLTKKFNPTAHSVYKKLLLQYANKIQKQNTHSPKTYQQFKCYGVYFSENMAIELDVCVISTILIYNNRFHTANSDIDFDSINFIKKVIDTQDYINFPHLVAPCYPSTVQIIYHLSRLLSKTDYPELHGYREKFLLQINTLQLVKLNDFDKIILQISIMQLGGKITDRVHYNFDTIIHATSFFYTSITMMIPIFWVRKLQGIAIDNLFGLRTQCRAYTCTFLIEYECLYTAQQNS